jgi:hypothetical protein
MGPALAVAGIVASLAAAAMSAESSMQSANYNAQVAKNNQTIANQNASRSLEQGQQLEENQRLKTGSMVSAIGAQEAASGVNPNEGSALNVKSSAAETGELDALTIRYNANLGYINAKNQANAYGSQAQLDTAQGEWGAMGSLLGGASSVSDKWMKYQQFGALNSGGGSNSPFAGAIATGSIS